MNRRQLLIATVAAVPAALLGARATRSAEPAVYAENGVAIDGTDPVAYFTRGEPVPGDPAIFSDWNGARLHFATAEHKAMFDADPEAFGPAYGGYCAYAVSEGYTAPTDPEAWTIRDGRLFLNYSKRVRRQWLRDAEARIERADANWPDIR